MANYIVSDTNLTAVANAIRTKGGTSEQLEFPDDFVSAIGDIQTGGGVTVEPLSVAENGTYTAPTGKAYSPVTVNVSGGGTDELLLLEQNQLISRTSTATSIKSYTYYGASNLQSISLPNATIISQYAFYSCSALKSCNMPNMEAVGSYAFQNCTSLEVVNLPQVTSIGPSGFRGCRKISSVNLNPSFIGPIQSFAFQNCTSLVSVDLKLVKQIQESAFSGCTNLGVIVLRKNDDICALSNINAFSSTPFASGGTGGTLYVPQALIASYQSASKWSTILGYANNQIKAIEGSIYE